MPLAALALKTYALGSTPDGGTTTRESISSDGTQGNRRSDQTSTVSADGRYVAFQSYAANLVSGDTNNTPDIFVRDRLTGMTTRVSVSSSGAQANADSHYPAISADGRYVTFESFATNLVPGDGGYCMDVFLHDRVAGTTIRVSVNTDGTPGNSHSYSGQLSSDGRYTSFWSNATNLVPDDTNSVEDIFVHDGLLVGPTATVTRTPGPTATPTHTRTPGPTATPTATRTPTATYTPGPSPTPTSTAYPVPTSPYPPGSVAVAAVAARTGVPAWPPLALAAALLLASALITARRRRAS